MRLYMVRHGIAVDGLRGGITRDAERPLTDEGHDEMKSVSRALQKLNIKPDLILSSPLVRARETAQHIADAYKLDVVITDSLAPAVNPSHLFKSIGRHPQAREIFLVGHEPDMGMFVGTLLFAGPEWQMPFKKAGICRVDVTSLPPDNPGVLKWYLTPKVMTSLAK